MADILVLHPDGASWQAAWFSSSRGMLRGLGWQSFSPASSDAPALVSGLARLPASARRASQVVLVPAGISWMAKTFTAPVVETKRQQQVIRYELEKQLPHAPGEGLYAAGEIQRDGIALEMLAVCGRHPSIRAWLTQLVEAGLAVTLVVPPPLLDYHAGLLFPPDHPTRDTLAVSIDEWNLHLTLWAGTSTFFRCFPLGWQDLLARPPTTEPISAALLAQFLAASEEDRSSFVYAAVQTALLDYSRRVSTEIARSIALHKHQHPAFAPQVCRISGMAPILPGISTALQERLQLPVEELVCAGRLQSEECTAGLGLPPRAWWTAGLLGAAVQAVELAGTIRLNLLPPELLQISHRRRQTPWLQAAATCFAISGALFCFQHWQAYQTVRRDQQTLLQHLHQLESLHREVSTAWEEWQSLSQNCSLSQQVVNSQTAWMGFLRDLHGRLQSLEDAWLEELVVLPPKLVSSLPANNPAPTMPQPLRMRLTGKMVDRENPLNKVSQNVRKRVNQLIDSLRQSTFIATIEETRFDAAENGILRFEIQLACRPDSAL